MRKAEDLRKWLLAYLPDLKDNPDRLQIYVENGQITTRQSRTLSFMYAYQIKVGIWEFTGSPDRVIVPLLAWIEREQPQLLRRTEADAFSFEAELLDSEASDLLISLDLTENVLVTARPDGSGYDIDHPPEPDLADCFEGVNACFRQGFGNLLPVAQTSDPAAVLTPTVPPAA